MGTKFDAVVGRVDGRLEMVVVIGTLEQVMVVEVVVVVMVVVEMEKAEVVPSRDWETLKFSC